MYKVTDVSAPALQYTPAGSYKALLCENTAFSVWLRQKKWWDSLFMTSRLLYVTVWDKKYGSAAYLKHQKEVCAGLFVSEATAHSVIPANNLANVNITSPRTRSRNLAPLCHNSPPEALSKHFNPLRPPLAAHIRRIFKIECFSPPAEEDSDHCMRKIESQT